MQWHFERRIRCPRRIGDKIGGNLQAIQINAKMVQLIFYAEGK
jgi:hypothetical protein